jgi:predicted DNA-binding protein YlxM (UPF0122 family)
MHLQRRNLGQGTELRPTNSSNNTLHRLFVLSLRSTKQKRIVAGEPNVLDETTLRRLYLEEQRSIREIAKLEHISTRAIYAALIHHHIPRRTAGFRSPRVQPASAPLDEPTLRRLYLDEERSIRNIAALYQVSTRIVYDALSRYCIPRRTTGHRYQSATLLDLADGAIDEATLRRLYEEESLSIVAIAASVSRTPACIRNALIGWGIARRKRGRQSGTIFTNQEKRSL